MIEILSWIIVSANVFFKICIAIEICFCLYKISKGIRSDQNTVVVYSLLGILMAAISIMLK